MKYVRYARYETDFIIDRLISNLTGFVEKVFPIYVLLDWKWCGSANTPTRLDITEECIRMIRQFRKDAVSESGVPSNYYISSGGITMTVDYSEEDQLATACFRMEVDVDSISLHCNPLLVPREGT